MELAIVSRIAVRTFTLVSFSILFVATGSCSGDRFSSQSSSDGGGAGATSTGGAPASTGGTANAPGGAANTGGSPGSGGAVGSGGTNGTGGASTAGGANGGTFSRDGGPPKDGGGGGVATGGSGAGGTNAADATAPHWCDGQRGLFCEDFDEQPTVDGFLNSWTTFSTTGGNFTFDHGSGIPSAPNALRIQTTAPNDVKAFVIHAIPAFATKPSKIRLEFDLRIDAGDSVTLLSGAAFAAILTGTRVSDGIIGLEVGNGPGVFAGYVDPSGNAGAAPLSGSFPQENVWLGRYGFEITYSGAGSSARTGCVQALVGGQPALASCLKLPASLVDPPFVSIAFGVYSGVLYGGTVASTGDVQLRFDNALLTTE